MAQDDNLRTNIKAASKADQGPDDSDYHPLPYYFKWSCGCQTKLEKKAFVIIPCTPDCHILKAVMGD